MCAAKPPKAKVEPLTIEAPPEEASLRFGSSSEDTKKRKKKTSQGTKQLMIPTSPGSVNTSTGSPAGGLNV